ncbi:MAG: hypothetical protein NUW22_04980 [Acidobacteria bacterium]|nr:hypothetical protein [Acidobacteriota bacterium]
MSAIHDHEADALPQARQNRQSVLALIRKSGPAFEPSAGMSIQERDLTIALLVDRLVPLLYYAMQAHALGAIDNVHLDELPEATITTLRRSARQALNGQSSLHRDEARRVARLALAKEVKDAALHFPYLNPCADDAEQRRRQSAMNIVMRHLELMKVDERTVEAFEEALATPITGTAGSQVARMAIGGWR